MKRTVAELAELVGGQASGDISRMLQSVASLRNAGAADLTYAEDKFHSEVRSSGAGCVIVGSGEYPDRTVILVRNPKLAFARAAATLLAVATGPQYVHASAVLAADVVLGPEVTIGAGVVIEAGARIGSRSRIESGVSIGANVAIGQDCTIYPRVVIYRDVTIGNRAIIHAGAVIGADGFGFVRDGASYVKFPQAGTVVIEDDVEIGANTCIDRGSLETTFVRRGVKLDNLVQIAHNVEVGENTVIASQTGVSGSCTIGAQSIIGGQVGMGERARLDNGTIIGGQAGVLNGKHVKGGEVLWGTPVRPLKEFLNQQAHLARLPELSDEVRRLRRELDEIRKQREPA